VVDGRITAVGTDLDHPGPVLDGDAPDARTGLLDRALRTHVADLEPVRTGTSRA
jgi:hypothetical protein